MTASRRNVLKFGSLALCGGAALATRGSRSALAAEAEGGGTRIESRDGTVSSLTIEPEDIDISLTWKSLANPADSVTVTLEVSGPASEAYDELFSGDIGMPGDETGSGMLGEELSWVDSGPESLDLFAADTVAASDFEVATDGAEENFQVDFRLVFEHTDVSAEARAAAVVTVSDTTASTLISDFEDGSLDSSHDKWSSWQHQNDGSHTIDDSGAVHDTWSLRNDWSGGINSFSEVYRDPAVQSDFRYSILLDNQSGNSGDDCTIDFLGPGGDSWLDFRQNGNVVWRPRDGSSNSVLQSWSANTVYDVAYYVDYENGTVDIEINGTLHEGLTWQPDAVDEIRIRNQHNHSDQNCSIYFDAVYED